MGMAHPQHRFDADTFLAWEATQALRHELVDGEVYAMAGAGDAHNRVAGNFYVALHQALQDTPCRTFMNDMKLHVAAAQAFLHPDIFVSCDERDFAEAANVMKAHPRLVVEVLSDGTAAYDKGRKFELYRSIEGLSEVVFVEAERRQVDLFRRNPADGLWVLHPASGAQSLQLASLGIEVSLDAVYGSVVPLS